MRSILVKICGITSRQDARVAVEAGADALGFLFYPRSRRVVAPAAVAEILREVPPSIRRVGVFVNPTEGEVRAAAETSGVDTLQFHGEESPEFCLRFRPLTVWKAFRVANRGSLEAVAAYDTAAWLLDTYVAGEAGGTGKTFHWELAAAARTLGRPIILAGGLTPDNVARALLQVQPAGVDVSSGVESAPGRKDPDRVRAFVAAVRELRG